MQGKPIWSSTWNDSSRLWAIAARGALVSEFPCGYEPRSWNFPVRNRSIAALSQAVLVVQAAARSGSLSTARWALDLGRDLFARMMAGGKVSIAVGMTAMGIAVLLGTLIGVLPGLGPTATIAMLLPITFGLPPVSSLAHREITVRVLTSIPLDVFGKRMQRKMRRGVAQMNEERSVVLSKNI